MKWPAFLCLRFRYLKANAHAVGTVYGVISNTMPWFWLPPTTAVAEDISSAIDGYAAVG